MLSPFSPQLRWEVIVSISLRSDFPRTFLRHLGRGKGRSGVLGADVEALVNQMSGFIHALLLSS